MSQPLSKQCLLEVVDQEAVGVLGNDRFIPVKLPWIFLGAPLTSNGAPRNIQGNLTGMQVHFFSHNSIWFQPVSTSCLRCKQQSIHCVDASLSQINNAAELHDSMLFLSRLCPLTVSWHVWYPMSSSRFTEAGQLGLGLQPKWPILTKLRNKKLIGQFYHLWRLWKKLSAFVWGNKFLIYGLIN